MKRGFSLVELLISISILAILTLISLIAYSSVQKNSRDAKRKSDLSVIQSALEHYHADQGYYPLTDDFNTLLNSGGALVFGTKTYASKMPKDPVSTGSAYYYLALPASPACTNATGSFCKSYCLYAKMENDVNAKDLTSCSDPSSWGVEAKNYEVVPN